MSAVSFAAIAPGHLAVVMGGASGIGLAAARAFAARGTRVAIHDRPGEALDAAAGSIDGAGAHAVDVADSVLPHRRCYTFDDTHSIFVSNAAKLEWKTAMTWDPQVLDLVHQSIEDAPKALDTPNRQGCPG